MNKEYIRKIIRQKINEGEINKITNSPMIYKKNINVPKSAMLIKDNFLSHGKKLYLVGGAVRDALLGKTPKDFDLASDATPDEVIKMLKGQPFVNHILETGKQFGIINVITTDGEEYEIARFRSDVGTGRRPDSVEFTTIDQDVLRRDLTINALFYDLDKKEIVDYVGGVEDIKNGIVRTVGNPEDRFKEDALRKLRAIRFAARLGSDLDKATDKTLKKDNSLAGVSEERIRDEFLKGIKTAKKVKYFLELLEKYNFFPYIFKTNVDKSNFIEERNPLILIANLLKNKDLNLVKSKLSSAKYKNKEIASILFLLSLLKLNINSAPYIKKLYKKVNLDTETMKKFAKLNNIDIKLIEALEKLADFQVDGRELQKQGFKGPEIGKEIEKLEKEYFKNLL